MDEGRGVNETRDAARSVERACYDALAMQAPPGKGAILPEVRATAAYDPDCRRCPRLAAFLDSVRVEHPDYFCRPVPPFGASDARLVIVGLAPGMHGANRTGRPFTGDFAGILLYATLHAYGFASRAVADSPDDGLALIDCRITNAVKCLPPDNKPAPGEVRECNAYLVADLAALPAKAAVLALGRIAHDAALRALGLAARGFPFAPRRPPPAVTRPDAVRQLPLQPLQHQYGTAHRADVPRGVRRDRRASRHAGRAPGGLTWLARIRWPRRRPSSMRAS